MMKRKVLLVFLIVTMLLSAVGCGNAGKEEKTDETKTNRDETVTNTEKPVEITVELFDRANVPPDQGSLTENRWTKWIQEEMLKQGVIVNYMPIPRGEEVTKINVLLASSSAPDIIFTYDRGKFQNWALSGGLHDLSDLIGKYGEKIKRNLGDEVLKLGIVDGKQYAIPAKRPRIGHLVPFIRKDLVDKLGLKMPANKSELVTVLKAFKEYGGKDFIPWSNPINLRYIQSLALTFADNTESEIYTTPNYMKDGYRDLMEWMNGLYKQGLIDLEFPIRSGDDSLAQKVQGNVGFFVEGWWVPVNTSEKGILNMLKTNVPGATFEPVDCFEDKNGKYTKNIYHPIGLYIMSPKTAKHPEAVVKYLNWLADLDTAMKLFYGIENEHYEMKDGIPIQKDMAYYAKTLGYISLDLALTYNPYPFPQASMERIIKSEYGDNGEIAARAYKIAMTDGIADDVLFSTPMEVYNKYVAELTKAVDDYLIKLIIAEDFGSVWENYKKDISAKGADEVVKERTEYYNKYIK